MEFSADQTDEEWKEQVAVCDEQVMEAYLEGEEISREQIRQMIRERKLFPCYFGSALKMTGVEEFLDDLKLRIRETSYPETFGAKIYKITRDNQGERLTHMKITGGTLKVKSVLSNGRPGETGEGIWQEKVNQIRIYSGEKYTMVSEVKAGTVCAVTGLTATYPGQGLGSEQASDMPVLEPVLSYRIVFRRRSMCIRHCYSFDSSRKKSRCYISYGMRRLEKSMPRSWERYRSRS